MILRPGSCPSPQTHPKSIPSVDFQFELCVDSQIAFYFGLWTVFYADFQIVFCTRFYSGYGPAWSSSQFVVKSVQIILQVCSGIHDFMASILQSCLIQLAEGLNPFHSSEVSLASVEGVCLHSLS